MAMPSVTAGGWDAAREAFAEAARWFVATTAQVESRWGSPGLGEWTVRDLVGHTSRALLTVERYRDDVPGPVDIPSAVEYFRRMLASAGDPVAVAERGREAGSALGEWPEQAVADIADRVLALLARTPADATAATPAGRMRVVDYLPTRTFELTVHTCDLAVALGLPANVPEAAAVASTALAGELASGSGQAAALLLAVTGRRPLPEGFTVL